ncbi:MAG: dTMP kinase [Candidatus Nanohaloarchaea archaeon]
MEDRELPGHLIVIEGPDGSGTTTQAEKLAEELDAHYTAEPTGGKIGEKVQEMITSEEYSAEAIALAFAADRATHVEEEIVPRLENGETVVCDRYYHSSLVYQPALGADEEWVRQLNRYMLTPDITLVLDISSKKALDRVNKRENEVTEETVPEYDESQASLGYFMKDGEDDNIFENLSFQEKVVLGYQKLKDGLEEPVFIVDSDQEVADVFEEVLSIARRELDLS